MIIRNTADARRALRWRPFGDHPGTKEAVKRFVDDPTPFLMAEAERALNQMGADDLATLAAWVRSAPVPRIKR